MKLSTVAPYVGAWIETMNVAHTDRITRSHPTWVRGLKQYYNAKQDREGKVAPYVGAWIET